MSRFTAAGVPISVLNTPTSFLYGAQASEGVAYIANAGTAAEFVQISDSTGTPGHSVPINPGEWLLLPYGAYNTIKTTNGGLVYAQPGFLNKKRFLGLASGDDIFNAEAEDIVNAFTTPATIGRKHLINMTVGALKGFGLWDLCIYLYVMAAETDQAGRIAWKNPGTFTIVNTIGTPTFTADRGFTCGSTINATIGVTGAIFNFTPEFPVIKCGMFAWNLTQAVPGAQINIINHGSGAGSIGMRATDIFTQTASPNITTYLHGSNLSTIAAFHSARRRELPGAPNNAINSLLYRNGNLITSSNTPRNKGVVQVSNAAFTSFAAGSGDFVDALAGYFITDSDLQHLLMYQVWQAYLSIIGAI